MLKYRSEFASSEKEAFRVLLVGLGKVGFLYDVTNNEGCLTHAKGLKLASRFYGKNLSLIALETSKVKTESFINQFPESTTCSEIDELPNKVFDLAILACTTDQIAPMFLDLQKKIECRHYILEKPVCEDLGSFIYLGSRVLPKTNIRIGFPRRSLPSITYLKEILQTQYPLSEWSVKMVIGGDFLNIGIHFLDLIYYLLGDFTFEEFTRDEEFVRFKGKGGRFTLKGVQVSKVNTEDSSIEFSGPVNINYSQAGRMLSFKSSTQVSLLNIDTSYEIQNMIGFEALDYTAWALGKDVSRLATLDGNPILEVLKVLEGYKC